MEEKEKLEQLKQYKKMIRAIAGKYTSYGSNILDDLLLVGEIAALKALDNFDDTKNCKMSTYIYGKVEGAIKDEIKTKYKFFGRNSTVHPIPLSDITDDSLSYEIEELLCSRNDNEKLRETLDILSEKEKKLLWLRYWEDMPFTEIARKMRISDTRASQIHKKILAKIRRELEKE